MPSTGGASAVLAHGRSLVLDARQPTIAVAAQTTALSTAASVFAAGTTAQAAAAELQTHMIRDAELHVALAGVMEDLYVLGETHGIRDAPTLVVPVNADQCLIDQGSDHTKGDDIAAICILHGVDPKVKC